MGPPFSEFRFHVQGRAEVACGDEWPLTVNSLAVRLLLLVEERVFVLGQHFLLAGHFAVPPLDGLGGLSVAAQGGAEGVDDAVNGA